MPPRVEEIDLLFQSVLARFFAIPARRPASGAVTFGQMRVLWVLDLQGPLPLGRVARRLGISDPAATELADRLARAGYVRRRPSLNDRRQVLLELCPKGRRMLADYARRRRERFERLRRILPPADMDRLAGALKTVREILEKWNGKQP
ncbi:MAG: MarR family winged helix-turn-helix transcriptional regulator [Planctomycetota bacterium]